MHENFEEAKRQIGCLNEEKKNMLAELNYAEVIIDEQINKIQEQTNLIEELRENYQ